MANNITFRTVLVGSVTEFCTESEIALLKNALNLVELIVSLARYSEEGVRLSPQVYIANDIDLLISMLPSGERLKIGSASTDLSGIQQALKKTAPLATEGWSVYLQDTDPLEYGVFCGSGNPLAVPLDDILLKNTDPLRVVKLFNVAQECVEIRGSNGRSHHVFLDHRRDDSPPPLQFLDSLVASIVDEVSSDSREPLVGFLTKLLITSMRDSHGCIVAVTNRRKVPAFLTSDCILLDVPIDFPRLVKQLRDQEIDSSVLENKRTLVRGMLKSDGILIFDNRGRVVGFNCFVKVKSEKGVVGGARRRAFASLTAKLGKGLTAAFLQSQDGWTDYKGLNNAK